MSDDDDFEVLPIGNDWAFLTSGKPWEPCRWCGRDEQPGDVDRLEDISMARVRHRGVEWAECAFCAMAIGDLGDDADPDEIRRLSVLYDASYIDGGYR